jgi:hypothetical protein
MRHRSSSSGNTTLHSWPATWTEWAEDGLSNAFNSVLCNNNFEAVCDELPELFMFIFMCYSNSSFLNFGGYLLLSDEGAQKGNPPVPLMFCLAALKLDRSKKSEFYTCYLDDGITGKNVDNLI